MHARISIFFVVMLSETTGPRFAQDESLERTPAKRQITVHVTAVPNEDHRFLDLPMALYTSRGASNGMTDDHDQLAFVAEVGHDERIVILRVGSSGRGSAPSSDERDRRLRAYNAIFESYSVLMLRFIRLDESDEYAIELNVRPTRIIAGSLIDTRGQPLSATVKVRNTIGDIAITDEHGAFRLGVPTGDDPLDLCVFVKDPMSALRVTYIRLSREDIDENGAVGALKIPHVEPGNPLEFRIIGAREFADTAFWGVAGITLVAEDGHMAFTCLAIKTDEEGVLSTPDGAPAPPPGRYYVSPGYLGFGEHTALVMEWLRNGHDLAETGLPMLEVTGRIGQTFEIDVLQCALAIRKGILLYEFVE